MNLMYMMLLGSIFDHLTIHNDKNPYGADRDVIIYMFYTSRIYYLVDSVSLSFFIVLNFHFQPIHAIMSNKRVYRKLLYDFLIHSRR